MAIGPSLNPFSASGNTSSATGTAAANTGVSPTPDALTSPSLVMPPDTASLGGKNFSSPAISSVGADSASTATTKTSADGDKLTLSSGAGKSDPPTTDPITSLDTLGDEQLTKQLEALGAPAT